MVINLAAQAGVRYSLKYPKTYLKSNIYGFLILLKYQENIKLKDLYTQAPVVFMGQT